MDGPKDPGSSARTDTPSHEGTKQADAADLSIEATHLVIHTVDCESNEAHEGHAISASFLDRPRLFTGDSKASVLRGKKPIEDVNSYIQQQENVCVVVYKVYHCGKYHDDIKKDFVRTKLPNADLTVSSRIWPFLFTLPCDSKEAKPEHESMAVLSDALRHCLEKLDPTLKPKKGSKPPLPPPPPPPPHGSLMPPPPPGLLDQKMDMLRMDFPYLSLYHKRQAMTEYITSNEDESRYQLLALQKYLNEELGEEYAEADKLFSSGRVSKRHFQKLFGPDQIVVGIQDNQPQAYMCRKLESIHPTLGLQCWTWVFDGFFRKQESFHRVKWPPEGEDTIEVKDLNMYPLRFDQTGLEERLRGRGEKFWPLRSRSFVSYNTKHPSFEIRTV